MYYITATDKSRTTMQREVMKDDRISKIVVVCDIIQEADEIEAKLNNRKDLKYVSWYDKEPYFNSKKYIVSYYNKNLKLIK